MRFAGSSSPPVGFREALFAGLAPDGGLYRPVETPDLRGLFASFTETTAFGELAAATASALLAPEVGRALAARICERAFPFSPRLRRLDGGLLLLELFHGPTCAFKDFGARFLAAAMEAFLETEHRRILILVATSGDTGGAVASAFHGRRGTDVVILYPAGRVSELQEKQLTTLGGNVHALEVAGSFDDCQRLAREAFRDTSLALPLRLTSANSINIGRLLPQAFYYAWAASQRSTLATVPAFCVPSGNFGNLTAGVYAWCWGLPVTRFIAATNANDVVPRFLADGGFRPRASLATLSNAMDVGNPSNFERLAAAFGEDWRLMAERIAGIAVTDADTKAEMRRTWEGHGVLVDPHTAVGLAAARRFLGAGGQGTPVIVLATAHPGKFADTVREATGEEPALPERLARCLRLPKRALRIGPQLSELASFLRTTFG